MKTMHRPAKGALTFCLTFNPTENKEKNILKRGKMKVQITS